jgi:hypothetical protein
VKSVVLSMTLSLGEFVEVRLREMIRERLLDRLPLAELDDAAAEVAARRLNPYTVVEQWLKKCGFA